MVLAFRVRIPYIARSGKRLPAAKGATKMTIAKTRRSTYRVARILGDVQAVRKGTITRRIARRAAGRITAKGLGGAFR